MNELWVYYAVMWLLPCDRFFIGGLCGVAISKYNLAVNSDVPFSTVYDLCSGRSELMKCSAETLYKISNNLSITVDELIKADIAEREAFENFKNGIRRRVSEIGFEAFITEVTANDYILNYWQHNSLRMCFYLLAMLDYVCGLAGIPPYAAYDEIRGQKLKKPMFPLDILKEYEIRRNKRLLETAIAETAPEFMRFNIVEPERYIGLKMI